LRPFGIATLALTLLAAPPPVLAGGEDVVIEDAWSRASIGTSRPGVAYMTLRNTGAEPVVVTGLRTDLAMMPMIHATTTDAQGVTRMSHMDEVEIAAGEAVALAPGGLHVGPVLVQHGHDLGGADLRLCRGDVEPGPAGDPDDQVGPHPSMGGPAWLLAHQRIHHRLEDALHPGGFQNADRDL